MCTVFASGCQKEKVTETASEKTEQEVLGEIAEDSESDEGEGSEKEVENEAAKNETEVKDETEESEETAGAEETEEAAAPADKVGILLAKEEDDRNSMLELEELKVSLEEDGYEGVFYFAQGDAELQNTQLCEALEEENLKALIISPVDPYGLTEGLEKASEAGVLVVDYEKLIRDTDKLSYFVTFDTRAIGKQIGENIVKSQNLDKVREAKESRTIEFFMGAPEDDSQLFLFNGIMEVLQEYLEDGTLVCCSGNTVYDSVSIMRENPDTARRKLEKIIEEFYQTEKTPDIICTASDAFALETVQVLEKNHLISQSEKWPLITGVSAEKTAVESIADGKIGFTILMDKRELAEACVSLVDSYLNENDVEFNEKTQYDNGVKIINTVTIEGKLIDKDNYQILVDNGFYDTEISSSSSAA